MTTPKPLDGQSRQITSGQISAQLVLQGSLHKHRHHPGYADLSKLMNENPETAVFRSFRELNMITLLRLQAELHDLEYQLRDIRDEDSQSGDRIREDYVRDFRLMRDYKEEGDSLQHDILVAVGEKLREYSESRLEKQAISLGPNSISIDEALSQARELFKFRNPDRQDVQFLREWLLRPGMGADFLVDRERTIWERENEADLISLAAQEPKHDLFTSWLRGALLDLYHRVYGHRKKVGVAVHVIFALF